LVEMAVKWNNMWHDGCLCGAGYSYPFGAPDFTSGFHRGSCCPVTCVSLNQVIVRAVHRQLSRYNTYPDTGVMIRYVSRYSEYIYVSLNISDNKTKQKWKHGHIVAINKSLWFLVALKSECLQTVEKGCTTFTFEIITSVSYC